MSTWQPGASREALLRRACLLNRLRGFFAARSVLEVDVPLLGKSSITDVNIDSIAVTVDGTTGYLQTSPEYFMKRLLADGSGDIYYLGKAFRDGEIGTRHNPEFTMLEWYRCNWDDHQLMTEVADLVNMLITEEHSSPMAVTKMSYGQCFIDQIGFDPHDADIERLRRLAVELGSSSWSDESRGNCLDLIFSLKIEPKLPSGIVIIHDYPECQCALSKISKNQKGQLISRRFEVFIDGLEIANGYLELTNIDEQVNRFKDDMQYRMQEGKSLRAIDQKFVDAVLSGLPSCAGVAVGLDRILMRALNATAIDQVLAFSWHRT
ncbi:MAG: EF-P lysine aminoacylase EpmA [Porticoccaceae bacterium]|nr:EF-P lysine aminoacylase EpmA [Porticoccaceae bacterium]MDG1474201.1 EF-P lysine aminoacylase EpmA [Porticoccaceae bacterium]